MLGCLYAQLIDEEVGNKEKNMKDALKEKAGEKF